MGNTEKELRIKINEATDSLKDEISKLLHAAQKAKAKFGISKDEQQSAAEAQPVARCDASEGVACAW